MRAFRVTRLISKYPAAWAVYKNKRRPLGVGPPARNRVGEDYCSFKQAVGIGEPLDRKTQGVITRLEARSSENGRRICRNWRLLIRARVAYLFFIAKTIGQLYFANLQLVMTQTLFMFYLNFFFSVTFQKMGHCPECSVIERQGEPSS